MQPWTAKPEAADLLAEVALNPPALIETTTRYVTSADRFVRYTRRDPRIRRLHEIRDTYFDEAISPAHNALFVNGRRPTEAERNALVAANITVEEAVEAARHTHEFERSPAHYLECRVRLEDMIVRFDGARPQKIQAKECAVPVVEVNVDCEPIVSAPAEQVAS